MTYKGFFDKKRNFGVEIEVFGVDQHDLIHAMQEWGVKAKLGLCENPSEEYWYVTDDGSIKGEDAAEICSPVLVGTDGISEVVQVLMLLNYLECKVNDSCGFHIHWNVEDYTGKNVLSLLRLYAKFENVIDDLVDNSRREDKNIHCRSLVRDDTLAWISELDKAGISRALEIALKISKDRPYKVNICSYLKYCTVEFRHHESTLDIDEVINWLVLTQQFVSRAKLASVSKEISSKPVLGELLRVLGMANYQCSGDALVEQAREWVKLKYSSVRRKKSVGGEPAWAMR